MKAKTTLWADWEEVMRDMETYFTGSFSGREYYTEKTDDGTKVIMPVTGISQEDIDITTDGDTVTVEAKKNDKRVYAKAGFKQSIKVGKSFEITKASAELKDGVLTLFFPYSEKKQTTKIKIN